VSATASTRIGHYSTLTRRAVQSRSVLIVEHSASLALRMFDASVVRRHTPRAAAAMIPMHRQIAAAVVTLADALAL